MKQPIKQFRNGQIVVVGYEERSLGETKVYDIKNNLVSIYKNGANKTYLKDGSLFSNGNQTIGTLR